jgi:hypothetical protein
MGETSKLEFVTEIVILKKKIKSKKKTYETEHWYLTVPVPIRKLIDRKNKTLKVTLERIFTQG